MESPYFFFYFTPACSIVISYVTVLFSVDLNRQDSKELTSSSLQFQTQYADKELLFMKPQQEDREEFEKPQQMQGIAD